MVRSYAYDMCLRNHRLLDFLAAIITEIETAGVETAVVSSFEEMVLNHVVSIGSSWAFFWSCLLPCVPSYSESSRCSLSDIN